MPTLILLYCAAFVSAFSENIVNVALLDIMAEFSVTSTVAQWLVTGYMVVTAIVVTSMAVLVRRFRVRHLYAAGALALLGGSVIGALAPSFPVLLAARLIAAIGSGIFIPLMMTSVLALAPRMRIATFLAIGSAAITLGPALAPVASGLATSLGGWRAIFGAPAALMLILGLLGIKLVADISPGEYARLDSLSLALSALGLTGFVWGIGQITAMPGPAGLALVAAILALGGFAVRQRYLATPMLDLAPLASASFWPAMILVVISMMTTFSMSVLLPLYAESVFGASALRAGLLLLPAIAVNAGIAVIAGRLMDRFGPFPLVPAGFLLIAVGQAIVAVAGIHMSLAGVTCAAVAVFAGVGLVMSPSQTAALNTLDHSRHAHGVALINTLVMVAAAVGPSLFIGVMASRSAAAMRAGVGFEAAQASGFAVAIWLACALAVVAALIAGFYAWGLRSFQRAAPASIASGTSRKAPVATS